MPKLTDRAETERASRRLAEWLQGHRVGADEQCKNPGCLNRGPSCRATLLGVVCLDCYLALRDCTACGRARDRVDLNGASKLCRTCICGPWDRGYVQTALERDTELQSSMGATEPFSVGHG